MTRKFITLQKKFFALFAMMLASAGMANAENVITISDLSIEPGQQKEVTISLDNEADDIWLVDGTIVLPEGLTFVPMAGTDYAAASERAEGYMININTTSGYFAMSSTAFEAVTGKSGVIATFKVEASDELDTRTEIVAKNFNIRHADNSKEKCETVAGKVSRSDLVVSLSFDPQTINVGVDESVEVNVSMQNDQVLTGFEANVILPDGVTAVLKKGDRIKSAPQYNAATGHIQYFAAVTGNDGVIFTLQLTAAEGFEGGIVKLADIVAVNAKSQELVGEDITMALVAKDSDGKKAADAIIDDAQAALDAAKADIEKNAADVADEFKEDLDALQKALDDLAADVQEDYDNAEKLDVDKIKKDADAIKDNISKTEAAADKAQKAFDEKKNANDEAYKALCAELAELQKSLDEANATINGYDPAVAEEFKDDLAKIQDMIDKDQKAIDELNKAMALTKDSKIEDADDIRKAIEEAKAKAKEMNDIVTGISEVSAVFGENAVIYNLRGQQVSKNNLTKGVYVINGKKVILK